MRFSWLALVTCLLAPAASGGEYEAERARAEQLLFEGKEDEYIAIIKRLGAAGDVRSQEWYGYYLWRRGQNVEAERWLMRAAETGDAAAQYQLGAFYLGASPFRPAEGKRLLELAAAQGNARAKHLLSALASPARPPKVINGKMDTGDAADFGYLNLRNLLLSNSAFLECYRTTVEDIDTVFSPPARTCKEAALREYGPRITETELLEFSRDIGGCIRRSALDSLNISEKDLLECTRRVR
jgi:hypothetical protein